MGMSERPHHPQDRAPSQPNDDDRDPLEYLRVVVEKQLYPNVDLDADAPSGHETEQSDLYLEEMFSGPNEPRRARLRLQHPDSTVSDISPAYTLRTLDAWLRGLIEGERGTIDAKADHVGDDGGEA